MISLQKISRAEWIWVVVVSFLCMIFTAVPYMYGWLITPDGSFFTGVVTISYYDTYTYLAWFEQARQGHFFFINLYSSEPQSAIFFHPLFYILGLFGYVSTLPNILIYHIARVFSGVIFLSALYLFISDFIQNTFERRLAFIITIISSGVGLFVSTLSSDLWMTETITFLSLYQSPLNLVSLTLILLIFHISLSRFDSEKRRVVLLPAALLSLLVIIHLYDLLIVAVVLGGYSVLQSLRAKNYLWIRNYAILILLTMPALIWQVNVLNQNVVLGVWATIQSNVPSYNWYYYVSGYGFLLVFAFIGLSYKISKRELSQGIFLLLWILIIPILLYFPPLVRFQRKFSEGLHIPIAIFASMGLFWIWQGADLKNKYVRNILAFSLLVILSMSNIYHIYRDVYLFEKKIPPFYMGLGIYDGAMWLKSNTDQSSIVLSSYESSNLIPGIAGRRVYVGNWDQTLNFDLKLKVAQGMLSSDENTNDPLKFFLKKEQISYIFEDDIVRSWGGVNIEDRQYLNLVYKNADIKIYKIDTNSLD